MSSRQRRLKTARKVRRQIRGSFDALRTGRVTIEDVLRTPPDALGRVSIYQVMLHAPGLGPTGIKKCLQKSKIWPEDKLGQVSQEDRETVIKNLPPRARYGRAA